LENPAMLDMWRGIGHLVDSRGRFDDAKVATWISKLKRKGHDGVILQGGDTYREFMVFDPTQIKSATGNSGAFDPSNPSILNQSPTGERTLLQRVADAASRLFNQQPSPKGPRGQ